MAEVHDVFVVAGGVENTLGMGPGWAWASEEREGVSQGGWQGARSDATSSVASDEQRSQTFRAES